MFLIVIGTFSVVALLTPGSPGWFLYLFLTPFYGIFPSIVFPPYGGLIAAGSWLDRLSDPAEPSPQLERHDVPEAARLGRDPELRRPVEQRRVGRRLLGRRRWRRRLLGGGGSSGGGGASSSW